MRSDGAQIVKRVVAALAVLAFVAGGAWLIRDRDPGTAAYPRSGDPAIVTAEVERRVLESLLSTRGTVVSPSVATLTAPSPPEGAFAVVVTGLPTTAGAEVAAGDAVVELNGRPVLAIASSIPLYRDLRPGFRGPDVAALQVALEAMGHPIRASEGDAFGSDTQAAVESVYEDAGYEARYTLGDKKAVSDARADADRQLTVAKDAANAAKREGVADPTAEAAVVTAQNERDRVRATEGVLLVAGEVLIAPSLPATLVDLAVSVGQQLTSGTPVATVGSPSLQVQIELTPAQMSELTPDVDIDVDWGTDYSATCAPGTVTPTSSAGQATNTGEPPKGNPLPSTAEPGAGSAVPGQEPDPSASSEAGFQVVVSCLPLPPVESLGESMRVGITARRSAGPVLVVPSTAITTTASGATFVEVSAGDGGAHRVEVTVGGEAAGFNAVEPVDGSLDEGDRVHVRGP
jgi:HlyD family secretion protein